MGTHGEKLLQMVSNGTKYIHFIIIFLQMGVCCFKLFEKVPNGWKWFQTVYNGWKCF